ncbi:unnamed protein product [Thlaspi arvense]|uniref:Piwi domain-containing protein n=1 Tax=Thlaspi arvense TaxID=13288 RepID=A0AAU9SP03_THLAR|nr:unnamed protein product [Thlaspi arvense]
MDSSKSVLVPMARSGNGSKGPKIHLLTNHFGVNFSKVESQDFFQYSVKLLLFSLMSYSHHCFEVLATVGSICLFDLWIQVAITYQDGKPVEAKRIGRKILEKVQKNCQSDNLGSKYFAYDGDKTLYTVGPLPGKVLSFSVALEEMFSKPNDEGVKRLRRPNHSKTFNVAITFATKISVQAIEAALQGKETNHLQDAIRVLDVILRQNAASQGCLLVRQSFFHNDAKYFTEDYGGFHLCRGFHSSFGTTQGGLSLNIDVSSTLIVKPGPVVDFLIAQQDVKDQLSINWKKQKKGNEEVEVEITVFDYYKKKHDITLHDSGDLRCINVGKPNRPTYIPMEHCHLVSLQRYTKALNSFQKTKLVRESIQKPQEKMNVLTIALKKCNYNDNPMLQECGVTIASDFTQVEGRLLPTPKLKGGNGEDLLPRNGRWNFNRKKLAEPATVHKWAVVNFSARCNPYKINIDYPFHDLIEEDLQFKDAPDSVRVEKMFEQMTPILSKDPNFILCILSERKNSDVYGPWKKKTLVEVGIVNQCIAPQRNVNDQYLTNVLLKINAKLGGLNSVLAIERSRGIPSVMRVPTIIIGMDVSHGSPNSDEPSVSAVVSSREWPLISKYRAFVRTQSPKVEMIDNLFNRVSDKDDDGIMRELLFDFQTCSGRKPDHIIIFRDGVSESQFNQVLNIELDQMMQACKFLDEKWDPKFTVIIAQKNHHTRFFQTNSPDNVPAGTIIDSKICDPRNNDFYLCAHAGMLGTTRPTHYHVLFDQIGFSTDDLQELVHSLSYVYQRSTTAISVVAPISYAHLAAAQMATVMKFEDNSETSSSHGGITTSGAVPVPPMPKLKKKVATSMFFC